jgi:hypothetical protein
MLDDLEMEADENTTEIEANDGKVIENVLNMIKS